MFQKFFELTARINAGNTLEDVLEYVYHEFKPFIPYDRIGLAILENEGKTVKSVWAKKQTPEVLLGSGYSSLLAGSSLETIIQTNQPRILNDLEAYLKDHPASHSTGLIVKEGFLSSLTCPLMVDGKPSGFLFFSSRQKETYKNAHVETFMNLAGNLSIIIEKARAYQRLVELNELKNRFLGIAAHDLRSPLALVKSYIEMIELGVMGSDENQRQDIFNRIKKTCDRMLTMVSDLLDVSAIESGKLELDLVETPLGTFLQESAENHQLIAKAKNMKVKTDIPPDLPAMKIDAKRIGQVLDNLFGNAMKFSKPGTQISLRAIRQEEAIRISVTDQGPGIPQTELKKLFQAFGKTSVRPTAGEKSTGLGLAIVKKIVELHGGTVGVDSDVGIGATFSFLLPLKKH